MTTPKTSSLHILDPTGFEINLLKSIVDQDALLPRFVGMPVGCFPGQWAASQDGGLFTGAVGRFPGQWAASQDGGLFTSCFPGWWSASQDSGLLPGKNRLLF